MKKNKLGYKKSQDKQSQALEFKVEEEMELLDFLYLKLSNKARNKVKSLLTHKMISVDGTVTSKHNYLLKPNQTVIVNKYVPQRNVLNNDNKLLDIIYEDDDIVVINKPAGLLTIANDKEKKMTAYHFLTEYVRSINPENRIYIIHRLDRDTSGIVMFAKNEEIKNAFQDNWNDLVSYRGYLAIVEGKLSQKSGRIESWLKETTVHFVYSSNKPGDGKKAITNYKVLKENDENSLLQIDLETGRKNQIRVQLKDLGHCVIGDKKYGAKTNPLKRLGLHANKLEFTHPITKKAMSFEAKSSHKFAAFVKNK